MPLLQDIKPIPAPSLGHELGVMFGFLGVMGLSLGLYLVGWQHGNIRGQRKEGERIQALRASGFLRQRQEEMEEERAPKKEEKSRTEESNEDIGEEVRM